MSHKLLFLIGGSAAYDTVAEAFVPTAGGRGAKIALLLQSHAGWKKYGHEIVQPWTQRGVSQYDFITPGEDGTLDLNAVAATLRDATGIFIGGGHTPTYHRLYTTEPVRSLIRERHRQGVPVAGMSAGALIALEHCALPADETGEATLRIVPGLNLVRDIIVGVHFSERNDLPNVIQAMAQTGTKTAWGLDDSACVVFEDGQFAGVLGRFVYQIVMSDFESRSYQMTKCTVPYHLNTGSKKSSLEE